MCIYEDLHGMPREQLFEKWEKTGACYSTEMLSMRRKRHWKWAIRDPFYLINLQHMGWIGYGEDFHDWPWHPCETDICTRRRVFFTSGRTGITHLECDGFCNSRPYAEAIKYLSDCESMGIEITEEGFTPFYDEYEGIFRR
jgi:hypothetical protein